MPIHSQPLSLPDELLVYFVEQSSLPTLSRFASTSTYADYLVSSELEWRYSDLLKRFVHDGPQFRTQLDNRDSIVSGSGALSVCSGRHSFIPSDLDVYCPAGHATLWVQYLTEHEGYVVKARDDEGRVDGAYHGGIGSVTTLIRPGASIDIVESLTSCATLPLPHFWTTMVMSALTGTGIISLYPSLLEDGRGLLTPDRLIHLPVGNAVDPIPALRVKYRDWGYDIQAHSMHWALAHDPAAACMLSSSPTCPHTVRWVGDRHCLQRNLAPVSMRLRGTVTSGTLSSLTTVWNRGGTACGGACHAPNGVVTPDVATQLRRMVE